MKLVWGFIFFVSLSLSVIAQDLPVVDFKVLEKEISRKTDTLKVINFWATSCKPCIEEFPYFIQAQEIFRSLKVKFIFVSLDFAKQREKAEVYIRKRGLGGRHFLLKDDPNVWIDQLDKDWGGDIPYTLLVTNKGNYIKHDSKFNSEEELVNFIKSQLK